MGQDLWRFFIWCWIWNNCWLFWQLLYHRIFPRNSRFWKWRYHLWRCSWHFCTKTQLLWYRNWI